MNLLHILVVMCIFMIALLIVLSILPIILSKYFSEMGNIEKAIVLTVVTSAFFLGMTYLIALFFKKSNFIEQVGSADAWIGFAGSIMGGFITMFALCFTLKNNQESNRKNHILSLKPYLVCNIKNLDDEEKTEIQFESNIQNYGYIQCDIWNVSNNLANEIKIIDEYSLVKNDKDKFEKINDMFDKYGISINTVSDRGAIFLAPNQKFKWQTNFGIKWDEENNFKQSHFSFKHIILFQYSDAANLQKYNHKFEYELNINVDINNKIHLLLWNLSNTVKAID